MLSQSNKCENVRVFVQDTQCRNTECTASIAKAELRKTPFEATKNCVEYAGVVSAIWQLQLKVATHTAIAAMKVFELADFADFGSLHVAK